MFLQALGKVRFLAHWGVGRIQLLAVVGRRSLSFAGCKLRAGPASSDQPHSSLMFPFLHHQIRVRSLPGFEFLLLVSDSAGKGSPPLRTQWWHWAHPVTQDPLPSPGPWPQFHLQSPFALSEACSRVPGIRMWISLGLLLCLPYLSKKTFCCSVLIDFCRYSGWSEEHMFTFLLHTPGVSYCYRLNVCFPQNSYVEISLPRWWY